MHKTKENSKNTCQAHSLCGMIIIIIITHAWSSMTIFLSILLLKQQGLCTKLHLDPRDFPALCKVEPFLYNFFVCLFSCLFSSLDTLLIRDPSLLVSKFISFHFPSLSSYQWLEILLFKSCCIYKWLTHSPLQHLH